MAVPVTPEHPKVPEDEWTNGTTTEGDKPHTPTDNPVEPATPSEEPEEPKEPV
jgi:hypothetical protein